VDPTRSFSRVLLGRLVVALAISFPLIVGGVVGVNMFIDWKIDQIPRVDLKTAENTDPADPANFLLIGSDTRRLEDLTPLEREAYGDPEALGPQRSDTLMVVHVEPEAKTGYLVSFPRDLVVDIPGVGQSKINAAFNEGPQRVVDTLAQNFNIPIHHYVEVDFRSFKGIVDAMGGVPVYLDGPSRDPASGFEFVGLPPAPVPPGCYVLDGVMALNYVRSRNLEVYNPEDRQWHADPRGDLGRIERQQRFMKRLATEAFRKSVNSLLTANRIADEVIPQLKADQGLSRGDINKLIRSFRRVDPNDPESLQMVTFPTVPGSSGTLGSILEVKQPEAEEVLARLRQFAAAPAEKQPKPSDVRVRVVNGSGQNGLAGKTQGELQREGFVTVGVGNKPAVRATEVRFRPGSQDKAAVVQRYLGDVGKLVEDSSIVEADVALVLGKDFTAVGDPAGPGPAPAPAPGPAPPSAPATSARAGGAPAGPPVDPIQC
jgi:polyisoprenyl-teichoic acid--peptidoglycan teichoic acid transferase